ncbi:MAG: member of Set1p complex, histone methyl transferase [Caeruleum heppii]|nr:MAG: member of Set1p complex, histone methyl transferase [Caeruleum heppii]
MAAPPPPPPPREPTARLADVISSYRPTKLFRPSKPDTSTTSLDFDDQGELLLTACDDESLQLYNCREGKHVKTLFSKKYGAHLARFTHHQQSVLYASTKGDDTIRYLSTHDNQYLRYFRAHTARVTSLSLSPANDTFLSSSLDNTVQLWSLNTPNPTGKLELHAPYLTAFDASATVMAIASPTTSSILLYDVRQYDKAPFATFDTLELEKTYTPSSVGRGWTTLEMANDGKSILLGTSGAGHFLLDAFDGHLKAFCVRPKGPTGRIAPGTSSPEAEKSGIAGQGDVCLSPDGRYVVGGGGQDSLCIWDALAAPTTTSDPANGAAVKKPLHPQWELEAKGPAAVVAFNPRLNLCVSADREVVFWVPDRNAMVE